MYQTAHSLSLIHIFGIDGVILTKMDGDTRGGAALSIKAVTGKPIFYVGMGEKLSLIHILYLAARKGRFLLWVKV